MNIFRKGATLRKALGWVVVALVFMGAFFVIRSIPSEELRTMKESPFTQLQLSTAQEVERWEYDKEVTLGKPIHAQITITYAPLDGFTKEDVFGEIVKTIELAGWEKDDRIDLEGYYVASKPEGRFVVVVSVTNPGDREWVAVRLDTKLIAK